MQTLSFKVSSQEQFDAFVKLFGIDTVIRAGIDTVYDGGPSFSALYQKYRDKLFEALRLEDWDSYNILNIIMESRVVFTEFQLSYFWDKDIDRDIVDKLIILGDYFHQNNIKPYGQWLDLFETHRAEVERWEGIDLEVLQFIYGNYRCYFCHTGGMEQDSPRILFPHLFARTETIKTIQALVESIAYKVEGKGKHTVYDFMAEETFYDTQKVGIKMLKDCQESIVRVLDSSIGIQFVDDFFISEIAYPPKNADGIFNHPFIDVSFQEKLINGTSSKFSYTFNVDDIPHTLYELIIFMKKTLLK